MKEKSPLGHPAIVKYPRTAHLFDAGGTATTTDDLVLPDLHAAMAAFCNGRTTVTIEEKVDGANLGISMDSLTHELLIQNRSHYISEQGGNHAQFNRLYEWTCTHREALYKLLGDGDKILYGEWLVALHSIPYHRLPGIFVAFDLFDKQTGKFFSRQRFHAALHGTCIPVVPVIEQRVFEGKTSPKSFRDILVRLLDTKSAFRSDDGPVEGIVLRIDMREDNGDGDESSSWLDFKYKVVRPDFLRGCGDGHWATRKIEKQRVDFEFREMYLNECYGLR
jgi:atypical dual specificity phosphatase